MAFTFNPFTGNFDYYNNLPTVSRGALLYGNSTPTWAALAVGAANTVLGSDGTDISWNTATGTGNVVRATSPTLVTPTLGAALATSIQLGGFTALLTADANNILAQRNSTTAQAFRIYNTFTDASNYERAYFDWSLTANELKIGMTAAGTGSARTMRLMFNDASTPAISISSTGAAIQIGTQSVSTVGFTRVLMASGNTNPTSGTSIGVNVSTSGNPNSTSTMVLIPLQIAPIINYSNATPGAGSYEALKITVTETALPTGTNYLIRASAGAAGTTDKFTVDNAGIATSTSVRVSSGSATAVAIGNAANQGFYWNGNEVRLSASSTGSNSVLSFNGSITGDVATVSGGRFCWSNSGTNAQATLDLILSRAATATLQLGTDLNGAAISQMLQACNGITGTDKTGGNFTLASGKGTGAGTVSSLIFQTPTALGSGTTAQSLATRLIIASGSITIADATDLVLNTTTGSKLATATGQKLGFWGATPVVQQIMATGVSHTVDDLITMLQTLGLCKQS